MLTIRSTVPLFLGALLLVLWASAVRASSCGGCPGATGCTLVGCYIDADTSEPEFCDYSCNFSGNSEGWAYDMKTDEYWCYWGCGGSNRQPTGPYIADDGG